MGWSYFSYPWKGAVIGIVTALISSILMVFYLLVSLEGVVGKDFLTLVAFLTLIQLVWGAVFGYMIGSFFRD